MKCEEQALFRYTWAGQDEKFCCIEHALQLQGVAQALGYYVQLIPLSGEEQMNLSCSQEARLTPREPDSGDSLAESELSNDEMDDTFEII
jgi:hypothetical protein